MDKFIYYEINVHLVRVAPESGETTHAFGSLPIHGDLQQHIEMAGRAAAVQAYFQMIKMPIPFGAYKP
jgi:hypothetical protein